MGKQNDSHLKMTATNADNGSEDSENEIFALKIEES